MNTSLTSAVRSNALLALRALCLGLVACSSSDPTVDAGDAAPTDTSADSGAVDVATTTDSSASPIDSSTIAIPADGTCSFTVDGVAYQSAAGDIFTLATLINGDLSVQCAATSGDTRHSIQLVATGVAAAGTYTLAIGQYSTQPATGGSPEFYRSTSSSNIEVTTLTATSIVGSAQFVGAGTPSKNVSVSFNVAIK